MVSFSKQIATFALTGVKNGRRPKTIVLYCEKSLNKHGSRSFMLIKYFYHFFTAVSARLKHNKDSYSSKIRPVYNLKKETTIIGVVLESGINL